MSMSGTVIVLDVNEPARTVVLIVSSLGCMLLGIGRIEMLDTSEWILRLSVMTDSESLGLVSNGIMTLPDETLENIRNSYSVSSDPIHYTTTRALDTELRKHRIDCKMTKRNL